MDLIEVGKMVGICLFAYLFCAIPFGHIISWAKGVNIRAVGSGNIGAANIRRALGWRYAFWVAGSDIWKGSVPLLVAIFLKSPWWLVGLAFVFCVLGATFSVWMKLMVGTFKAGKGVSVFIGALFALAGWKTWLIIMGCWLVIFIFFVRRKMSAASLILTAIILISIWAIPIFLLMLPMLLIAVGLIWYAHRENIQRILKNQEPSTKLPSFFNKIPDDLIGWTIEKLQLLVTKLQNLKKDRS